MTTQGPVQGGCSPAKESVQTLAPVRPLSIEENERRVYEVGGPHGLSILRRVLPVSYVRRATQLPDLHIRMPLSIGAELCGELPRTPIRRTSENSVKAKFSLPHHPRPESPSCEGPKYGWVFSVSYVCWL